MCGIAGVLAFDEQVHLSSLVAMKDAMVHRGPDGGGEMLAAGGRVGLASRRLAIIDLSPDAAQPMFTGDGSISIVYNGEIYNYLELRKELESAGGAFHTSSDTEVILKAYESWGTDCLSRLNGMFAFALWDGKLQQLFVARDRFGERPFYYHLSPHRFVFASEIKALLIYPDVPRHPNEYSIVRYLSLAQVDGEEDTFFDGIRQLPPAHHMLLRLDGSRRLQRYWGIAGTGEVQGGDREDHARRFRELFIDSVRLRLRSDVPVGSSLSGGLDSSSVVGAVHTLLDEQGPGTQSTFSARHADSPLDEGRHIDAVLDLTRLNGHSVWMKGEALLEDVDRLIWHQEEPFVGTSQYAQYRVMELARTHGVTVLLDGQGADEVLGGYHPPSFGGRYIGLLVALQPLTLVREMLAYGRRHGQPMNSLRHLGASLLPRPMRLQMKMRYSGTKGLLRREVIQRHWDRLASHRWIDMGSPLKTELHETLTHSSLPSLLRYGDRNATAFSREARLPFLDHRLVEYAFRLPDDMLVRDGVTKVVLRDAVRGLVPETVRQRMDKIGFATPEAEWFRGPLRGWMERVIAAVQKRGILNAETVTREWEKAALGRGNPGTVWRIVNLELWLAKFF